METKSSKKTIRNNRTHCTNSRRESGKLITELTEKRIRNRLMNGAAIKPCGYDEKELGRIIIEGKDHKAFINFPELMNDEEYVLHLARTSLNPLECGRFYFYQYINKYLLENPAFRYKFLKQLYLNENIYKIDDLCKIVEWLELDAEYQSAKWDAELKADLIDRLAQLQNYDYTPYHCSGLDGKELKTFKSMQNTERTHVQNRIEGIKSILRTFNCLTEDEKLTTTEEEYLVDRLQFRSIIS